MCPCSHIESDGRIIKESMPKFKCIRPSTCHTSRKRTPLTSACAQWDVRRTYLPPPKRRDGGSDASKHPDEGLVGCAMHTCAKVVPNRDLVQHGLKAVAEVLLMPHLRATRLDVTKSGAHVCEETHVRITDPAPPRALHT